MQVRTLSIDLQRLLRNARCQHKQSGRLGDTGDGNCILLNFKQYRTQIFLWSNAFEICWGSSTIEVSHNIVQVDGICDVRQGVVMWRFGLYGVSEREGGKE